MKQVYTNEILEEMVENYKNLDHHDKELAKQYYRNKKRQIECSSFVVDFIYKFDQEIIEALDRLGIKDIIISDPLFNTGTVEQLMNNGWKLDKIVNLIHYDGLTEEERTEMDERGIEYLPTEIKGARMIKA